MTLDALLAQIENVTPRGSRYRATCPAHRPDRSPSLQVTPGDTAILLRCWAGCTLAEICASLNITQQDLFYDAHNPTARGHRPTPKPVKVNRVALAFRFELGALDFRIRAKRIVEMGTQLDVASLNDHELDRAMHAIAKSHADVARAELFEHVADTLRERDFCERKSREQPTRVA